ncbi:MAG: phosphoenolpyruvate synthase [Cryobacterium sp.]|nr:phosphoenolpyruvate synthase [Oligoflexia bacterium]
MLVTRDSTLSYATREAGGKGLNLFHLASCGFPVPPWVILGASYFRKFVNHHELSGKIDELLRPGYDPKSASEIIRQWFLSLDLPAGLESDMRKAYSGFENKLIAVRSSALDEDSAGHSFAGQLSTFLYVSSFEDAKNSVLECWASGFSERGLVYRKQSGLEASSLISVGIVFQEMIDCDRSGVLFTCDPITGDGGKIFINSVYGIGEGFVSGLLESDAFVWDKDSGCESSREVVNKDLKLVQAERGPGTREVPVEQSLRLASSLSDSEIKSLSSLGVAIERTYRFPQDIEWGIRDGTIFILQSRPVTTAVRAHEGLLYVWDNSNIVESYGGITLPLTFTFARYVYHQVYVQFCQILLIPDREIKDMDYFLRNMLGSFYGRVFYNILNWYKLTSILPGFKYNRGFMETMMGTPHSLSDEIAERISPSGAAEKISTKIRRTISGLKFLYYHFRIQSVVDRFLVTFHIVYDDFRRVDYERMSSDEVYAKYQELERRILRRWEAPIINDYLCMIHFGLLKKLTAKWLPELGAGIQNDLLCGEGNLESAEPTRELIRMAGMIEKSAELKKMMLATPAPDLMEGLRQSPHTEFKAQIDRYIDLYGFRCMNEMKLEQTDLHKDPTFLFVCLKNYLRSGFSDLEAYEQREQEIRGGAEKKVSGALSGLKLLVYRWSLKNARQAVKNRENTRFCRTRIYGIVRRMFCSIGRDFALRGMIERPEEVFYITVQELDGAFCGALATQNLKALIRLRKEEYAAYNSQEPAPRFMTRGPVYWMNEHFPAPPIIDLSDLPPGALRGAGCCPGIVEGRVKVILSPDDDMELNKDILVTLRTDPGWIPLYPSASALLVERGGLLSHSAIVAREMGLPTIVGIQGLTEKLKTGMRVRIDGQTGVILILEE